MYSGHLSNPVTLFVNPLPSVVISAAPPASVLPTQTTTLTANATPAGGTYAWFFNGTAIPGATAVNLGPLSVNDLGTYRVVYTDANGRTATSPNFDVSGAASDWYVGVPRSKLWYFQGTLQ